MRKHYVPAILGLLFMAALIVLQSNKQCETPLSINYPKKITVKIELGDKFASTLNNAVSFLIQKALYRLAA